MNSAGAVKHQHTIDHGLHDVCVVANPRIAPATNSRPSLGEAERPVYYCVMDGDRQAHLEIEEGQLMERGHAAGDFLEAYQWRVVEQSHGLLVVQVHLPDHLKNPQGQLFGGFTPTYVDLVSIYTVHTVDDPADDAPKWLTTINMRCDYFEPIVEDTFIVRGELVNKRGLTSLVSTKFLQGETLAAHAITTIRELPGVLD